MTNKLSRPDELRNDLDNLHFSLKYYIGVLAELEQLGKTHTKEFKEIESGLNTLKHNIRRVEEELERIESEDEEIIDESWFSNGMHW